MDANSEEIPVNVWLYQELLKFKPEDKPWNIFLMDMLNVCKKTEEHTHIINSPSGGEHREKFIPEELDRLEYMLER